MLVFHWKMCICDTQTIKILIFHWFSEYFVHSATASGTAGWARLDCLGGLGGRGRPRASEEQKPLKNLAKMARHFPGLFVFQYFLTLMAPNPHFSKGNAPGTSTTTLRNNH